MKEKSFRRLFLLLGLPLVLIAGLFWLSFKSELFLGNSPVDIVAPTPAPYPRKAAEVSPPPFSAKAAVVMDVDSGIVLWEKNLHQATSPASTTKIMTALVSLENYNLEQILTVSNLSLVDGQKIKLQEGEKLTAENLLYGLLVASANDAALVLAQNFPGGREGFVWAMNQKAQELNLKETNFTNPVGYYDSNHYTSAYDLARLAVVAMRDPEFAKIVGTQEITITDIEGKISHPMSNVNTLLGKVPGIKGVKTGWTQEAGECLVSFIERDGRKLVVVVLGSKDRFGETTNLIDWVFANYYWESLSVTD